MDSTTQTKDVTPENVRKFLLTRSSEPITAIEDEFRIQLDLALLDAEDLTRIGPLAQYIAERAQAGADSTR